MPTRQPTNGQVVQRLISRVVECFKCLSLYAT